MTVQDKEDICLAALNSPEGQAALAEALSGPIVMFATEEEREEFWSQPQKMICPNCGSDDTFGWFNVICFPEEPHTLGCWTCNFEWPAICLIRFLDVEEEIT